MSQREHFTLDFETRSKDKSMVDHAALEPWRRRQGKAEIMACDILRPDGSVLQIVNDDQELFSYRLRSALAEMKGHVCWAHNATFDVAWAIADLQPTRCGQIPQEILDIDWRDTGLLTKWLINGQVAETSRFGLSLANLVKTFLPEHPDTPAFLEMKSQGVKAGENTAYWLERGTMDVKMTQALAMKLMQKVPESMRVGLMTEFGCIIPVANSWITGFRIDQKLLADNEAYYLGMKSRIAKEIGVSEALFSSPKQLGKFLFADMSLTPHSYTPSGNAGTSKGDLMWIEYKLRLAGHNDKADILRKILEAKESATIYSKYVKTTYEALGHTGDGFIYSSPRIFGTYTGRMTYSNSTTSKDFETDKKSKWKTSIAMHQIPRKAKRVRQMLLPPEGFKVGEFDAAGQESRLMAIRSKDPVMINIFQRDMNFHSMTGASIIGMEYDVFEERREQENGEGHYTEARQRGKLTNLACNFRIGGKALSEQAFEKYEVMLDISTGNHLVKTFAKTYRGVPQYWDDVIFESKTQGYTEAFGGRRFKLSDWQTHRWGTESSAIMVPIQGSGASMKEVAITELKRNVPEFNFALDLHDASFGYMQEDKADEIFNKAEACLNSIDYSKYWGFKPPIKLPYDGMWGTNFADVK
jgi:DNA polymerase I-like protein with 3'-5' exonuclease and polymerase domains